MLRNTYNLKTSIQKIRENFLSNPIFERKENRSYKGSSCFLSIFSEPIDQQYDLVCTNNLNVQPLDEEKKFGKLNYSTDSLEETINLGECNPLNKTQDSNGQGLQESWNMTPATTASSAFYQSGFSNFNITDNCFKTDEIKIKATPLQKSALPFKPQFYSSKLKIFELDSVTGYEKKISENLKDSWRVKVKLNKFKSFLKIVILLKNKYKKEESRAGNLIMSYISRQSSDILRELVSNITLNIPVPIFSIISCISN
jgi:hypothetical protein